MDRMLPQEVHLHSEVLHLESGNTVWVEPLSLCVAVLVKRRGKVLEVSVENARVSCRLSFLERC